MHNPESNVPANWRTGPDRFFTIKTLGQLPNPGTVVWFNGRFWIDEGKKLRPPSDKERIKIDNGLINGSLLIPCRSTTKVPR